MWWKAKDLPKATLEGILQGPLGVSGVHFPKLDLKSFNNFKKCTVIKIWARYDEKQKIYPKPLIGVYPKGPLRVSGVHFHEFDLKSYYNFQKYVPDKNLSQIWWKVQDLP